MGYSPQAIAGSAFGMTMDAPKIRLYSATTTLSSRLKFGRNAASQRVAKVLVINSEPGT
jgi:hypothetical protein